MRGRTRTSHKSLPDRELRELSDLLTIKIYHRMGHRAYALSRRDIAELTEPYTDDLPAEDRRALAWMIWDLLQEGMELEFRG